MEKQKRALVVKGDEEVLISLRQLLEEEGIETTAVFSSQEASEPLTHISFDLLPMGDYLPDLSCEQLLREIQRQGGPASILVMGFALSSAQADYEGLGAAGTVLKRDFGAVLQGINSVPARRAFAA